MSKILVTGCAGFIGSHVCDRLLSEGHDVVGIDNFDDFYDPAIKERNIASALKAKKFKLYRVDILDQSTLARVVKNEQPEKIVHLAARGGVRPSILNPTLYTKINVLGTVNMLKAAVDSKIGGFIFGSSSSVYGGSKRLPFAEDDPCGDIISPYGSSKRSAEFFVESFHRSYGLKATILRLFTVYGPRGRPDMAPALFSKAIMAGESITQFGSGRTSRDYTYIADIVDGIKRAIDKNFDFEIINLGNSRPMALVEFIKTLEKVVGKRAKIKKVPMQTGDMEKTWANISLAKKLFGWQPKTKLVDGLREYIGWYRGIN